MKRENLISYAANFVSFLLDQFQTDIDKIVLFGSVARGDFDDESDIDLFVDTKKEIQKDVLKTLSFFRMSETQKKWELKGLKNELSIKVGDLNKWKLKRDILTDGIILYGKFKELPDTVEYYLLIKPSFKKFSRSKKVSLWRSLYGYSQKTNSKTYKTKGIVNEVDGKRIESGIIIKMTNKKQVLDFLNKEKISYTVNEIWSDNL